MLYLGEKDLKQAHMFWCYETSCSWQLFYKVLKLNINTQLQV